MLFIFRGYMAPEYVVRGKLSEKADVYSFGVLVVEIVSGKRNSSYVVNSSSILQTVSIICPAITATLLIHLMLLIRHKYPRSSNTFHWLMTVFSVLLLYKVWRLYGSNRLSDIVDPILEGNFPEEEACRLLRIGLLCAQASAELRPSMSVVVKMITDNHEIPQPMQPPFISSGSSELSKSSLPGQNNFQPGSNTQSSGDTMTESLFEPRWVAHYTVFHSFSWNIFVRTIPKYPLESFHSQQVWFQLTACNWAYLNLWIEGPVWAIFQWLELIAMYRLRPKLPNILLHSYLVVVGKKKEKNKRLRFCTL